MPRLTKAVPRYSKHRASGQAIVELCGKCFYLGPHGTKASRLEFDRIINLWLANGRQLPTASGDLTIVELAAKFRRHAERHYRKNGRPTGETQNFDDALRPLLLLFGRELVADFGPVKLRATRELMIHGFTDRRGKAVKPLCRAVINRRVGRLRHVFRWGVGLELCPPSLAHALDAVAGLKCGRTDARERPPVAPVDDATVEATLPYLPPVVRAVVQIQRLTGCRPGEVCAMRPRDIDRSVDPWLYRPPSHKTEHFGRERVVCIGPKAQAVLLPYLLRDSESACFSPAESERQRKAALRARRKTPVQPSQIDRSKPRPKTRPTNRYTTTNYTQAIRRAADAADAAAHAADPSIPAEIRIVERWTPHRLRHAHGTAVRKQFDLEHARASLGHASTPVTEIYAARDLGLAAEVALKIG